MNTNREEKAIADFRRSLSARPDDDWCRAVVDLLIDDGAEQLDGPAGHWLLTRLLLEYRQDSPLEADGIHTVARLCWAIQRPYICRMPLIQVGQTLDLVNAKHRHALRAILANKSGSGQIPRKRSFLDTSPCQASCCSIPHNRSPRLPSRYS